MFRRSGSLPEVDELSVHRRIREQLPPRVRLKVTKYSGAS
jgi:hypothetical protein